MHNKIHTKIQVHKTIKYILTLPYLTFGVNSLLNRLLSAEAT